MCSVLSLYLGVVNVLYTFLYIVELYLIVVLLEIDFICVRENHNLYTFPWSVF